MEISCKNNSKLQIPCGLFLLSFHLLLFNYKIMITTFPSFLKIQLLHIHLKRSGIFFVTTDFAHPCLPTPAAPPPRVFLLFFLHLSLHPDNNFTRNLCCQSFFVPLLHLLNFQIRSCSIFSCQITFSNIVSCLCSKICHTIKLR